MKFGGVSTGAALGRGCRARCVHDKCLFPAAHHSGGAAGAAHHQGHFHPRRGAETGFHGLTVQQNIEIPRLQFLDKELTCSLLRHTCALAGPDSAVSVGFHS